ncbi:MAG TPA: hypothetical protein VMU83_03530 [Hanamia sp.]|nr:hypothetical protein [Hanamia sp.]
MTEPKVFEANAESKGTAKQLRLFAFLAWIVAIAGEIFAILKLLHNETLTWLIVAIVIILALSITGSLLWKKANRLDPSSKSDKTKFFIQSQLGAIMGVLSFLPLVILIFTNKNLDGKTNGIAGAIGIVALLIAGITGVDFNPPSIEQYTNQINAQTDSVKQINMGNDLVYWTPEGHKYHLYQDCYTIKGHAGLSQGTIKQVWESKGISELCRVCEKRAMKEHNISPSMLSNPVENAADSTK